MVHGVDLISQPGGGQLSAENGATRDELERRIRELSFLEHVVKISSSALDHEAVLRLIIDETVTATNTQVCSLYLWDEGEKALVLTATNGLNPAGIGNVKLGLGEGITGWVAAQRQAAAVPDVRSDPRFSWVPNLDEETFISMLSVPIISQDRVVGVMNVQKSDLHEFTQEEIDFVSAIAAQLAGIIQMSALSHRLAKQLELERQAVSRLEALDASKSTLMSTLSHDFRGPLSIATSYIHGLINRLEGEDRTACEEVLVELGALGGMVDNLMLSLEIEAQSALVLDLGRFDLVEVVRAQSSRVQQTTDQHVIRVESSEPQVPVSADRLKIQAVMVNLLGNAIKYSPQGGDIRVDIEMREGVAEVSVTDSGIGLGGREAEALFERYGRGEGALDHGISGHGLGLFICRQIVEAHGGLIYARGLKQGTCFTFTLPLNTAAREG